MIIKSYEIKKNKLNLLINNFFLLYGENLGLKKDIKNFIKNEVKQKNNNIIRLNLSISYKYSFGWDDVLQIYKKI